MTLADELEALAAKATPGPWAVHYDSILLDDFDERPIWSVESEATGKSTSLCDAQSDDVALCVALRNNADAIVKQLRALEDAMALLDCWESEDLMRPSITHENFRELTADTLAAWREATGGE